MIAEQMYKGETQENKVETMIFLLNPSKDIILKLYTLFGLEFFKFDTIEYF